VTATDRGRRWYACPRCGNAKAGKEPGAGRITAERVGSLRATYDPPIRHPRLDVRAAIDFEDWRLTCPCGNVWTVERET
jgi:hypothetical protein